MKKYILLLLLMGCTTKKYKETGSIERISPQIDAIITPGAVVEVIAEGFEWSEGPLWLEKDRKLIFSDVAENKIFEWTEQDGLKEYLSPSGFTGQQTTSREPGSNGLTLDAQGRLVLCQHGDRRLAAMNASLQSPEPEFITLADRYNGMRFNSPNDAVHLNNKIYFTDPPYGLGQQMDDPAKEIPFQGVYCYQPTGEVKLLVDSLTRPNGLAFMKNGSQLLVSNSDPESARWYLYTLQDDSVTDGRIFFDATTYAQNEKGLPDGLKIDSQGNVFASGPGGVWIFSEAGEVLGRILLEEAASNVALTADEKTLFITNDMYVLRVIMR